MLLLEDRRLLQAYRAGEREALARVFRHYQPQVVALCRDGFAFRSASGLMRFRGYRSSADLFDVVQEVFRRAFEERARIAYGGLKPFSSYLFVITRNVVISRLRADESAPATEPLETSELPAAPQADPEEQLDARQRSQMIGNFLGGLSAEEREFVRLRFEEDLAQERVAESLAVGRKKVRLLELGVRKKLRGFLAERGITPEPRSFAEERRA